jgi:Pentapeptide repeats (8 copies)/TIR domain
VDRDEAIRLLKGGSDGIREWNRRRGQSEQIPHLNEAGLSEADLRVADLRRADLRRAVLSGADLFGAVLSGADLSGARCGYTMFGALDLSEAEGLEAIEHLGPSTVGVDALVRSRGRIPEAFLRGCGLTPWEVLAASLYQPELNPTGFVDLQYRILDAWTKGRSMINGCFISYSWKDAKFVDKLRDRLVAEGVNVWLDRHDMVAGTIQDQVWRAIQVNQCPFTVELMV